LVRHSIVTLFVKHSGQSVWEELDRHKTDGGPCRLWEWDRIESIKLIADIPGVSIAAINDDNGVTISGDSVEIKKLEQRLKEQQVFAKMLRVDVP
jgi:acyl transferase domain-containing protein